MDSWQEILRMVVRQNRTFSLYDRERNEFKIMDYFVNNSVLKDQLVSWLLSFKHMQLFPFKKSNDKSQEYRRKGNSDFQAKNYQCCLEAYGLSLQYASWDSEDFALALANRSAALFYMGKYKACIQDIELALECNYPAAMMYKLYLRAAQCYSKLQKKIEMNEAVVKLRECISKQSSESLTSSKIADIEKQIEFLTASTVIDMTGKKDATSPVNACVSPASDHIIFEENSEFLSASKNLSIKFSVEKGRYVVANQDIKKGDTLFYEKPFAFVLLDNGESDAVCANCCNDKGDIPIPCKFCACTIYCSKQCMEEAWSTYHCYECFGHQIDLWNQIGIAHLTVRTFLKCCAESDMNKFNTIHHLVTNIDKIGTNDMYVYGVSALMMTLYLKTYTDFFQTVDVHENLFKKFDNKELNMISLLDLEFDNWTDGNKEHYVSGLILRHMMQLICNGHAITKLSLEKSELESIAAEYQCRVATAIYPSASMMNHSCKPNIINSFKGQYLIVKATEDIASEEEVLNCYGPHYRRMALEDRQTSLKNQYCFTCECKACTDRALQNFADKYKKLNCKECFGAVKVVNGLTATCLSCDTTYELQENTLYEIEESKRLFAKTQDLLRLNKTLDALETAKQCLEVRTKIFYKHHETIAITHDLIGKILATMGRWLEAVIQLEYSLTSIEERYGSDSIEFANELNKLTDICIRYLDEEENINTKQYKNILKKTRRYLRQAEEILRLNYGPWNNSCRQITEKVSLIEPLFENLHL
ncbi:SET and MYND domain-containing protein 4-like [Trichogramma pretiosum]|uniref:SET and MYND domain-containing protein 4-like n=1 Tax=Trichogramma pretiosum TaxID=7493 RepID=UPI0006C9C431|nr:SET and MYND domain-containing protein 4-like [Trichogramma pretiosum]